MTSTSKSQVAANVNGKIMDIPWNDFTMITNTKVHRIPSNDKKVMALNLFNLLYYYNVWNWYQYIVRLLQHVAILFSLFFILNLWNGFFSKPR